MKSSKTLAIVLLALTSLGGAGLAWRQYRELIELRATGVDRSETAALKKRLAGLERRNQELQDQLAARIHDRAGDRESAAAAPPGRSAVARGGFLGGRDGRGGPNGGRGGFPGPGPGGLRAVMASPEVQALVAVQQKARLENTYGNLFRNLNLTAAQQDKVESLLLDRQSTLQDVLAAARDQGINPRTDRDAFGKLLTDAQASVSDSLKSVLGDSGFAQLQNYDQTMPERNLVNQLQQRLSYSDAPLTFAQSEQLVQILAASTPPSTSPSGPGQNFGGGGGIGGRGAGFGAAMAVAGGPGAGGEFGRGGAAVAITPAVISQAQSVLASNQLAALQEIQQQQQAQQQLQQVIGSALRSGSNGGGAASNGTAAPGGRRRGGG